ncbi:hypothetical protein ACJX0J_037148, partial [Zea mays]
MKLQETILVHFADFICIYRLAIQGVCHAEGIGRDHIHENEIHDITRHVQTLIVEQDIQIFNMKEIHEGTNQIFGAQSPFIKIYNIKHILKGSIEISPFIKIYNIKHILKGSTEVRLHNKMFHSFSHQHLAFIKADNTCYFANGQRKLQKHFYFQQFLLMGNNNTLENDILRHELDASATLATLLGNIILKHKDKLGKPKQYWDIGTIIPLPIKESLNENALIM